MVKKAQSSFEFLSTYVWVFLSVTVTIGTLFYFNVFDPQRYLPEECEFGQNIICEDWNLESGSNFNMNLMLKNNLEKSIEPTQLTLYDNDYASINCEANVYCPYQSSFINWTDDDNDGIFTTVHGGKWSPGMSCRLELVDCSKSLTQDTRYKFKVSFTFKRIEGTTQHTTQGKVFTTAI
ncbi:MAG: hypothetical protein KKF89_04605 [Nanoarchaeota archaeon]|nr:hypothetical protein [Nanoarchaeota archaeon]MBU1854975.1 hypothetical protein [Nanoarchaeota archaeon]